MRKPETAEVTLPDPLVSGRLRRAGPDALALLALALVVSIMMWSRFWHRPGLGDWDIMNFYLPWYVHLGESLRSFDIPGWNPYIFSGVPFAGNPQSGWTYVPAMASFSVFPPILGYKLFFAFHLMLGGIATFGLARLLRFGTTASFAAGCVFALGQNLGATRCCTNHIQLAVWIPVGMVAVELSNRASTTTRRMCGLLLGGFAVSQMIAGWVGQGAYNGILILGAYLLVRALFPLSSNAKLHSRLIRVVADGMVLFGTGAGLAAAGLLPRLDAIRRTFLGTDEYQGAAFAPDRGWDYSHIARVMIDFRLTWHPYYFGGATLVLAVLALTIRRWDRTIAFFIGFVAIVMMLPGRPTPIHELFYLLPRFRGLHLHDPGRVLAVLPIGISLLVAVTVQEMAGARPRRPWVVLTGLAALWAGLILLDVNRSWSIAPVTWATIGAASTIVLVWLLYRSTEVDPRLPTLFNRARVISILLIFLTLADPAGRVLVDDLLGEHPNDGVLWTAVDESAASSDPGGAGQFLLAQKAAGETFRYFGYIDPQGPAWQGHEVFMQPDVLPVLANNRSMRLQLEDVQGYDPAQIERYRSFFAAVNGFERDYHEALVYESGITSPLLDLLNVRYVLLPVGDEAPSETRQGMFSGYREVFRSTEVIVLENPNALPRAWFVHEAVQMADERALDALASQAIDPRTTAILSVPPPPMETASADGTETIEITTYEPDLVRLTVDAADAGLLILGDVFDPGWKAYVDGEASRIYATDALLRGVAVPAGRHEIEFRYEPASLQIGLGVTLLTLLGMIALFAGARWTDNRAARHESSRQAAMAGVR